MSDQNQATTERNLRKTLIGVVHTAKMDKTRRVEVPRLQKHPKYGKYVKKRTVCYVHDENNETRNGDTVEIMETRPLSKLKTWRLVRVVSKAPEQPHHPTAAPAADPPAPPANQ